MTKLTLLLATFALFLLVANASFRTTIEIDEENQDCQQQCQQQQELLQCQLYMRQQSQRRGRWDNQQQYQRECCRQLQQMNSGCRCQCLEQAARRQQQQGEYGSQEIFEIASEIPPVCNVEPRRGCDFRSPYVSF